MRDIRADVRSTLESEPRIGAFELSDVAFTDDGALIIEGEVGSVMAKKLALERVGAMPDVDLIVDRLHVRPAEAMGDAEIRAHLRNAFLQEPSFAGLSITQESGTARQAILSPPLPIGDLEFAVEDGIVTLNGNAPGLATKRLAGLIAWWVPGSRDVINGMAVPDSEADSPQAVEEAVRIALEKDPFVNASQIRVGARHHVVRLTGLVSSQAERDMAENDAWYVFGVDDVINEIKTRA
jgi:osmotically-inducible protein OsmY